MASPRRLLAVVSGLLAAGWVFGWAARGDDPPAGPAAGADGVRVRVERADGTAFEGTADPRPVRLLADFGAVDLDLRKVAQIAVLDGADPGPAGGPAVDVTLADGGHLAGSLPADAALAVTAGGRAEAVRLGPGGARVVTFPRPKDPSLAAALVGLVTLSVMEVVLGVDNIIFLAIVAAKLPKDRQPKARRIGLIAALGTRLLLLAFLSFLLGLTKPVVTLPDLPLLHTPDARGLSWRDLILLAGGAFLIGKSVFEMHEKLEAAADQAAGKPPGKPAGFVSVIAQIAVIDIVFSLDSVVTAVGMVGELWVMVTAMLVAVGVMMVAAGPIAEFVDRHPTVKVLALSFLILIGALLVAEGLGQHIDKGYVYFAMAFGVGIELVNLRLRGSAAPPVAPELPAGKA